MLIKLVILAISAVPSIMATMSPEEIAKALIVEKDTGTVEKTFQGLHKKHGDYYSYLVLDDVAQKGHPGIVATCLRTEQDPFPNDKMRVSGLVHSTLSSISDSTFDDSESFAKVITSFTSTDVKPLVSIRNAIFYRDDAMDVLKGVMNQVP
jgi:hypothetical protein